MKHHLSLVFVLSCLVAHNAAADPQTEQIRQAAKENSSAFTGGNYNRLVDLTYPRVVELLGGREKMIEALRHGTQDMKSRGSEIVAADVAEPKEVFTAEDKRFAVVPMTLHIKVPQGLLRLNGFLLAVSTDQGKTWTFIDGAGLTREKLLQVFPDFPSELTVPERQPPVLEPKKE
jgi:hypothetical protein